MMAVKHAQAFLIYGHRGARGLAPENTLAGFKKAIELNVDYIDMDVVMTRDDIVVVHHDLMLNPLTTQDAHQQYIKQTMPIRQLFYFKLQQYDVGKLKPNTHYARYFSRQKAVAQQHIMSLNQALDFILKHAKPNIKFQIELKNDPEHPELSSAPHLFAHAVAKIIHEKKLVDRTEVQAFDWRCLYALQKINPRIKTAFLTDTAMVLGMRDANPHIAGNRTGGYLLKNYRDSLPFMIKSLGGKIWGPEDRQVNQQNLREAHAYGLKVVTWSDTTKTGKDIDVPLTKKMIQLGVDGIITDRPDVVRSLRMSSRKV